MNISYSASHILTNQNQNGGHSRYY